MQATPPIPPIPTQEYRTVRPLPKQPIPVWAGFFLILAIVNCGISLISTIIAAFKPGALNSAGIFICASVFSILLIIAIIVFALLAWKGSRKAKNTFLVLYCIALGIFAFVNFLSAIGWVTGPDTTDSLMGMFRNLILIGWYLYYFNRDAPKAFFSD